MSFSYQDNAEVKNKLILKLRQQRNDSNRAEFSVKLKVLENSLRLKQSELGQIETPDIFPGRFEKKDLDCIKKKWALFLDRSRDAKLSLYLNIPFCRQKCRFCMFYSRLLNNDRELEDCVRLLMSQADELCGIFSERKLEFHRLYIGGGTPSILSAAQIGNLLEKVFCSFRFKPKAQLTFEGDPTTLTKEKVAVLAKYGVGVCLGLQSTDKEILSKNCRGYADTTSLRELAGYIKSAHIDFSVDLMLGLSHDTEERFLKSFGDVLAMDPDQVNVNKFSRNPSFPIIIGDSNGRKGDPIRGEIAGNLKEYPESDYDGYLISAGVRSLLAKYGYFGDDIANPGIVARFWRNGSLINRPYYSVEAKDSSELGLGINSKSRIGYGLNYVTLSGCDDKGASPEYWLYEANLREQMRQYIVSNFLVNDFFSSKDFQLSFGCEPQAQFPQEFKLLEDMKLLKANMGRIYIFYKFPEEKSLALRLFT